MEQKNYTINHCTNQRKKTKKFYNHLNETDRKNIEVFLRRKDDPKYTGEKITITYIAKEIGVNKSTISREIKRGLFTTGYNADGAITRYFWDVGERVAKENRNRSRQKLKLNQNNKALQALEMIINKEKISPEDAVDKYEDFYKEKFPVCIKTIYKYIRLKIIKVKKGSLRCFKFKKRKKQPKTVKRLQKGDNIANRPIEAENRLVVGHWEGDTIHGGRGGSKDCLLTLAERYGRGLLCFKLPNRTAESVVEKFDEIECRIGTRDFVKLFATITFDNGVEFSKIDEIEASALTEKAKRIKTYFANAYHSWERGTNENTNGWVRHYFPKGTDFSTVSEKQLLRVMNKINYGKRRVLGGMSAIKFYKRNNPEVAAILEQLGVENPYKNMGSYLAAFA